MQDPRAVAPVAWEDDQENRVAAQIARIEAEEKRLGIIRIPRGRKMRVIREDLTEYQSLTAAAAANGIHKVDNICQAIRRGGRCAGWLWAYAGGTLPPEFHAGATRKGEPAAEAVSLAGAS